VWLSRTGSVTITDDAANSRIVLTQDEEQEVFDYTETGGDDWTREEAIKEAREAAEALIKEHTGARIIDETEEQA
jgi:hypothetical protein